MSLKAARGTVTAADELFRGSFTTLRKYVEECVRTGAGKKRSRAQQQAEEATTVTAAAARSSVHKLSALLREHHSLLLPAASEFSSIFATLLTSRNVDASVVAATWQIAAQWSAHASRSAIPVLEEVMRTVKENGISVSFGGEPEAKAVEISPLDVGEEDSEAAIAALAAESAAAAVTPILGEDAAVAAFTDILVATVPHSSIELRQRAAELALILMDATTVPELRRLRVFLAVTMSCQPLLPRVVARGVEALRQSSTIPEVQHLKHQLRCALRFQVHPTVAPFHVPTPNAFSAEATKPYFHESMGPSSAVMPAGSAAAPEGARVAPEAAAPASGTYIPPSPFAAMSSAAQAQSTSAPVVTNDQPRKTVPTVKPDVVAAPAADDDEEVDVPDLVF